MSEAEEKPKGVTIVLSQKEYDALRKGAAKALDKIDFSELTKGVTLDPSEKKFIVGIRIGMDLSAIKKKAWAVAVICAIWALGFMLWVMGYNMGVAAP